MLPLAIFAWVAFTFTFGRPFRSVPSSPNTQVTNRSPGRSHGYTALLYSFDARLTIRGWSSPSVSSR